MESTLKAREADDPHDAPAVAPDVVPAAWADRVLADITRDAVSIVPEPKSSGPVVAAPTVDTTFRPTAVGDIKIEGTQPPTPRWVRRVVMTLFALCSAILAAAWQHYGDSAKTMIAGYAPPFVLSALMPAEQAAAAAEQPNPPAALASTTDHAPAQAAGRAAPADNAAPAAAAPNADSAQLIQSMARDLAAMGAQIEQLKASVAELKANQQQVTPVAAHAPEARPPETKPPAPPPRPKISAALPPPRPAPAAAPLRRPPPGYPPAQAATAPMQLTSPPPPGPPPPASAVEPRDEPVVRPPMPLR